MANLFFNNEIFSPSENIQFVSNEVLSVHLDTIPNIFDSVCIDNIVATDTSVIDNVVTAETSVRIGDAISVMSYLNPLAPSFDPSLLITSSNYLAGPTSNLINVSSASGSHIQKKEIINRLNPLAPCFKPFSMTGNDNSISESTLNPNASIFYIRNSEESKRNENSIA